MATDAIERLNYFQRQYLGAEDFKAQQAYHRDMRRRHNLGQHTWGIDVGLELVEQPRDGGDGVDTYVQPGMAVDGFGREIFVLRPHRLEPELFDAFINKQHREVWIAYDEQRARRPRAGYELCDVADQFGRVQETFRIVVEPGQPTHDPIVIAGKDVDLPPLPNQGGLTIPADASVPYQEFSDGENLPRWLVRLGSVNWDGTQHSFVPLPTDEQAKKDELLVRGAGRRHIGNITAEVLAPVGELRIRDRYAPHPLPTDSKDAHYGGVAVQLAGSLDVERLLRARQDAYIDGHVGIGTTKPTGALHVRKDQNEPARVIVENTNTDKKAGTRFIARESDKKALEIGHIGSGVDTFRDLHPNTAYVAALSEASALAFNHQGSGPITFHTDDWTERMRIAGDGNVGIGTLDPKAKLHIAGGEVRWGNNSQLLRDQGGSIELGGDSSTAGAGTPYIDFHFSGLTQDFNTRISNDADGRLSVTASTLYASGKLGVGIAIPAAKLHVLDNATSGHACVIGSDPIVGTLRNQLVLQGTATHSEARLGFATTAPDGGGHHTAIIKTIVPVGGGGDLVFQTRETGFGAITERVRITHDGKVGIGTGTNIPTAALDVVGTIKSTMWKVTQFFDAIAGPLPRTSAAFTTGGGTLVLFASGSGFASGVQKIGMEIRIDGAVKGHAKSYTNEPNSHKAFTTNLLVIAGIPAGSHTVTLATWNNTLTDSNDFFTATVLELPF
jgi:hypothetical protein